MMGNVSDVEGRIVRIEATLGKVETDLAEILEIMLAAKSVIKP